MPSTAAGPFRRGDRVHISSRHSDGEITADLGTQTIRAFGVDVAEPEGEIRHVTIYAVRLDSGLEVQVADRDDQIVRQ